MTTNIALNEMLAATVAKIRTLAETGAPLTLQLASVIRAEARTSRAIELGSDAPLSVGDCLTMEAFTATGFYAGGEGVQSDPARGGEGVQSDPAMFVVHFDKRDALIGPFPSHDAAQAWAEASIFVACDVPFEVRSVGAPRLHQVQRSKAELPARTAQMVVSDVRAEFGDYGEPLPVIPFMYDASWHNDVCPVLRDITGRVELWCDYADVAKREFAETPRYSVQVDGALVASGEILDHAILGALREALIGIMIATWNYERESACYALDTKGFTTEFRA